MHYSIAQDDAVGPNHFSDGKGGGNLHRRNPGFLQFRSDRSAAASASPSSGRENDGVDAQLLGLFRHLPPHAPSVGKRIGKTRSREKLFI